MSDLMLDVGQATEVKDAFRRGDWTNADVKRFSESDKDRMKLFRDVLLGRAVINVVKHVIDCDADPFLPNNWKVEEHRKGGQVEWDAAKVAFYLSKPQEKDETIGGNDLRKELKDKDVLNANVLDYLLAHPELIPDEWKKDASGNTRYIFFWGTIYRHSDGDLIVRCLFWRDGRWRWGSYWLDGDWRSNDPAALFAS